MELFLKIFWVFLPFFSIQSNFVASNRIFEFKFNNVSCEPLDSTFLTEFNCAVTQAGTVNAKITIIRPANLYLNLIVDITRPTAPKRFNFINGNVSLCEFLNAKTQRNVYGILRSIFKRHIDTLPTCPFEKQPRRYLIRNFTLDPEQFPNYVPKAFAYIKINLHENGQLVAALNTTLQVVYKKKATSLKP